MRTVSAVTHMAVTGGCCLIVRTRVWTPVSTGEAGPNASGRGRKAPSSATTTAADSGEAERCEEEDGWCWVETEEDNTLLTNKYNSYQVNHQVAEDDDVQELNPDGEDNSPQHIHEQQQETTLSYTDTTKQDTASPQGVADKNQCELTMTAEDTCAPASWPSYEEDLDEDEDQMMTYSDPDNILDIYLDNRANTRVKFDLLGNRARHKYSKANFKENWKVTPIYPY
ncbi:uncharacterized protein LOC121859558 isoform X1 [Homarus americanus]|uniref:uncharacterized protein LOC121859558 isoform X1 n=1 Tax=Homarus americanus TaxID=6706 RepID=UPI001C4802C6|nr:uncharacterized protein LOC121859558 isoform X1 [Homarus americanus]XP_042212409.1 uncharacterized protein LOC121859558 isoform X1 [Homarus americanus]